MFFKMSNWASQTFFRIGKVSCSCLLFVSGFAQVTYAAPDIEMAPRLSNEDFGPEQYPGDYALAMPAGEAKFYPSGGIRVSQIENLYYQAEGRNNVDATQYRVIPKFDLVAEGSKSVVWGVFRGDLRQHQSGDGDVSNADATDYRARGFAHFDLNNRHRLDVEATVSQLSADLGVERTRESENAPLPTGNTNSFIETYDKSDTYRLSRYGVTYSYGNPRSRGEIVAGVSAGKIEYTENKENLKEFNRNMSIVWGRFSYKMTGKTTLYSRLSFRDYDYTDENVGSQSRNRETTSLTLGAVWRSTGLLYGDAYVTNSTWDYVDRERVSGAVIDGNATTVGANIYWAIRSYSTANFFVREFIDDRLVDGSLEEQKSTSYGVRWKHGWSERFNTTLALYANDDEVIDGGGVSDRTVASLEARLTVRRWLNLLVGTTVDDLDSDGVASDRKLVYLGLEGNL